MPPIITNRKDERTENTARARSQFSEGKEQLFYFEFSGFGGKRRSLTIGRGQGHEPGGGLRVGGGAVGWSGGLGWVHGVRTSGKAGV